MFKRIRAYFPNDKSKFKMYWNTAIPVMIGSIMYSLNSFIDNFMVGHIAGGLNGLFAANTWTGILFAIYIGVAVTGAILFSQYYYSGQIEKAQEVIRLRNNLNIIFAVLLAIPVWINPQMMIEVFLKVKDHATPADINNFHNALNSGVKYIRISTISWIIMAFTFNHSNILREMGYGKWTMYAGLVGLSLNATLNFVTIFGLGFGTEGAAMATVAGRVGVFTMFFVYIQKEKLIIEYNPLVQFKIGIDILKKYFIRLSSFIFTAGTLVFINFRNYFYNLGFPQGSIENKIGAAAVLSLTSAILNIFTTTFNAISAVSAKYVGGELGKNNIDQAVKNGKELKGFLSFIAFALSLILFAISFLMPYLTFLVGGKQQNPNLILEYVKYSLWPLCLFYPFWIWFRTGTRVAMMGGKVNLISFTDFMTSGPMQLSWLGFVMLFLAPHYNLSFPVAYFIFFLSDIPRGIIFEIIFHKMNWAHSITHDKVIADDSLAANDLEHVEKETFSK